MAQNLLPNLIIIGAMKCGTTSLYSYLNLHPEVHMSPVKELDFFIEEKNWKRGTQWYCSQFTESAAVIGEASPNYTKYPAFKGVPERMSKLIPNAKLIYLVRDPINRAISHYFHQYTARKEHRSLNEAFLDLNNNHYMSCSLYASQLDRFLAFYSLSNILVISLEELERNRQEVLSKIFRFLDVDPYFWHQDFARVLHESRGKERLTRFGEVLFRLPTAGRAARIFPKSMIAKKKELIKEFEGSAQRNVATFLSDDMTRLRKMTNSDFSNWTV